MKTASSIQLHHLIGGVIVDTPDMYSDGERFTTEIPKDTHYMDVFPTLLVKKGSKEYVVLIQTDEECNGPGAVSVEAL